MPPLFEQDTPRPGGQRSHGERVDSRQTKHNCGCRTNGTKPAVSSLLPWQHSPWTPTAPGPTAAPLRAGSIPTCRGAAGLQRTLSRGHFSTHKCPWQRAAYALHLSRICRVMSWGADGVQRTPETPNKESARMGFPQPVAGFFPPLLCRPAAHLPPDG